MKMVPRTRLLVAVGLHARRVIEATARIEFCREELGYVPPALLAHRARVMTSMQRIADALHARTQGDGGVDTSHAT